MGRKESNQTNHRTFREQKVVMPECLIWICTVCICPEKRLLDLYGLKMNFDVIMVIASCHIITIPFILSYRFLTFSILIMFS